MQVSVPTVMVSCAQDIVTSLRAQFAYITLEGLRWRMKLREQPPAALNNLHGVALRLALEQPEAWEYRLFGQALSDEVQANANLRREYKFGVVFGAGEHIPSNQIPRWIQTQTNELQNLAKSLDTLINVALQQALRPAGVPGDVTEIVFVAQQIGTGYRHALEWSQRVRRTHVEEEYRQLLQEMSLWTDNIIETIENYGPNLLRQIEERLQAVASGAAGIVIDVPLVLERLS